MGGQPQTMVEEFRSTPEGLRAFLVAGACLEAGNLVCHAMKEQGLDCKGLSRLSGLPVRRIRRMLADDSTLGLEDLAKLLVALGYRLTLGTEPIEACRVRANAG